MKSLSIRKMEGLLIVLFTSLTLTAFAGERYRRKWKATNLKLKRITDVEEYCKGIREHAEDLSQETQKIIEQKKIKIEDRIKMEKEKLEAFKSKSLKELEDALNAKKIACQKEVAQYEEEKRLLTSEIKQQKEAS